MCYNLKNYIFLRSDLRAPTVDRDWGDRESAVIFLRNWMIKIAVLVIAVAVMITAVVLFKRNNDPTSKTVGTVTVELTDLTGKTERHELSFSEGDTLESLLQENFTVEYQHGQYGAVLIGIGFIKTDFQSTYVSILVNGEYAMSGLSGLELVDGYVYSFVESRI